MVLLGENDCLLGSKIIYSLSCGSAGGIGRKFDQSGSAAYLGYEDQFVFIIDLNRSATPLKDMFARPFFDSSNKISLSLIKGCTTREAFTKGRKSFKGWIEFFRKSKEPEAPYLLSALIEDYMGLSLHGDESAVF